jgi:hypothetical protein
VIFPFENSQSSGGGCWVDFQITVEIDDPDNNYPVTASLQYQGFDSDTPQNSFPTPTGPSTVPVYSPQGPLKKRWWSDPFTVSVDTTLAETNPCNLVITASDGGLDTPEPLLIQFNGPCVPGLGTRKGACASSLPQVEIIIRVTGGHPEIIMGQSRGDSVSGGGKQIESGPTRKAQIRMNQRGSENTETRE